MRKSQRNNVEPHRIKERKMGLGRRKISAEQKKVLFEYKLIRLLDFTAE